MAVMPLVMQELGEVLLGLSSAGEGVVLAAAATIKLGTTYFELALALDSKSRANAADGKRSFTELQDIDLASNLTAARKKDTSLALTAVQLQSQV